MNKKEVKALLGKARDSIRGAKVLFADGLYGFSAARSYYAMFYVAEALLLTKDLSFSKHSAVIAAFGEHFSKTGILDKKFHRYLLDSSEVRETGDYEITEEVPKEAAEEIIKHAEEFSTASENYLKK